MAHTKFRLVTRSDFDGLVCAVLLNELDLIDDIKFEDEVAELMQSDLKLSQVRVVKYLHQATLADLLLGSATAREPDHVWQKIMDASVPRALYYCSWLP